MWSVFLKLRRRAGALAGGTLVKISEGTAIRIGRPAQPPDPAVAMRLAQAGGNEGQITALYMFQAAIGTRVPYMVVGLTFAPETTHDEKLATIGRVAKSIQPLMRGEFELQELSGTYLNSVRETIPPIYVSAGH